MKRDKYYLELEEQGFYNTVDKRSKDYREYKKWEATYLEENYKKLKEDVVKQSKGLGDTIAKITKVTGIDKLVEAVIGEDCGCDERKDKLNKLFNYNKLECATEEDFNYLTDFFKNYKGRVSYDQKVRLIGIYNFLFHKNESLTTSCVSCVSTILKNLKKYLVV